MTHDILMTLIVNAAVFTVLFALMLLMRRLIGRRISAVMQYMLWAVVVVKLIIPFGFESSLSPFGLAAASDNTTAAMTQTDGGLLNDNNDRAVMQQTANVQAWPASGTETADTAQSVRDTTAADTPVAKTTTAAAPVDWTVWALAVWMAGALIAGAVQYVCAVNLRRRVYHAALPVAGRVMRIAAECRGALGVRRRIDVRVQSALDVPFVMGAVRPVLVLPAGIEAQSDVQIRHICLHELTHVKHGDLVVIAFLNILRAVYWFNPFVWLCFKLIRKDMETACDARVIGRVGMAARQAYIGTVLQFTAHRKKRRLYAAMGMADRRLTMEQRIRGMFKTARTGRKTRVAALSIAVVMLAACVLTACQPTPEQEVVVNRSELDEKIAATATPGTSYAPYEAPSHWADTVERGALTVCVDTDVVLPDVGQYPVTILEPVTLSQARIDEMVRYFAGDSELFCWPSVFTRADYQEMLIEARRGQLVDGEYVVNEATERYAKSLEEKVANAPEDSSRVYTDTTLTYQTDLDGNVNYDAGPNNLNVGVELEDGSEAMISAQNFTEGYGNSTSFSFSRMDCVTESQYEESVSYGESGMEGYGDTFDSFSLDEAVARGQAEKAIADLCIEDMALVNEERAVLRAFDLWGISNDMPDIEGYVFEYVRSSGGISGYQLTSWSSGGDEQQPDYSPPFFQEMMTIAVSEAGVEYFSWSGMAQVAETVSDNVTLLPFEDIQQALIDQIYYENAPETDRETITINVLSAELRVGYISVKDNTQQAMLVPMWVFETSETFTIEGKTYTESGKTYQFNAIDGGVIAPSVGAVVAKEEEILAREQE